MNAFLREKGYDVGPSDSGFGKRSILAMQKWTRDGGFGPKKLVNDLNSLRVAEAYLAVSALQRALNALAGTEKMQPGLKPADPLGALNFELVGFPSPMVPVSSFEEKMVEGTFTTSGTLDFELVEMQDGSKLVVKVASITTGGAAARVIPGLAVGMRLAIVNHESIETMPYNEVFQLFFARPLHLAFVNSTSLR